MSAMKMAGACALPFGAVAIASQSVADAPSILIVAIDVPSGWIAKSRAESPESLFAQSTFADRALGARPDVSRSALSAIVPAFSGLPEVGQPGAVASSTSPASSLPLEPDDEELEDDDVEDDEDGEPLDDVSPPHPTHPSHAITPAIPSPRPPALDVWCSNQRLIVQACARDRPARSANRRS